MSSDEGKLNHSLLNVNNIKYDLVHSCRNICLLFSLHVESRWTPIHFLGRNSFFLESYNHAHFQIDR